jgi:hypothetical protein
LVDGLAALTVGLLLALSTTVGAERVGVVDFLPTLLTAVVAGLCGRVG